MYFSLLRVFFSTRIQKAQVQDSDRTNDEDPQNRQRRRSCEQTPKQLQLSSDNGSPSQDGQKLQNKYQENYYIYETKVVFKIYKNKKNKKGKKKGFKKAHQEMGSPISVVTTGLRPKGCQSWFPIQSQKQKVL